MQLFSESKTSRPIPIDRVGHQEGIIVNNIEDLDITTSKEEDILGLTKPSAIVDRAPVEQECHDGSRVLAQPVQVEGSKKAFKDNKDCLEELGLVDLPNGSHTPDCLGGSDSVAVISDEKLNSFCVSTSEDTQQFKSQIVTQRRKRKKYKSKKKIAKKRRISLTSASEALQSQNIDVVQQCVRCCAGGGGGDNTQKNQSCTTGNGQCTTTANGTCVVATNTHTTQQGGGGSGGGDGDDPNNHKKKLENNLACQTGNPKKVKKTQTSNSEMEVDAVGTSSKDSPMDISDSSGRGANSEEKEARPEEKPPEKVLTHDMKQPSQDFLINWNCRINHFAFCKTKDKCTKCFWVAKYVNHCMPKEGNSCGCQYCNLWPRIIAYHRSKCTISGCPVCEKARPESRAPEVEQHIPAEVVQLEQEVLNVPTSGTSLDQEETVVYCVDGIPNWTHFREHEDYTFKQKDLIGKGGNGEVHGVELHAQFKNKYLQFSSEEVVVKKATVKDDEMAAYKAMAGHPNIVKTYAVVKKTDGDHKHLIVMEKCEMSLQHYLDAKSKRGEVLSIHEIMYEWVQVLDAVVFIHNLRIPIIHKDIKSGNVLRTKETNLVRAKLADFDAVKLLHNEYTHPGMYPRGTPCFIAYEVVQRCVHGRPADVFSIAVLLIEMFDRKAFKTLQVAVKEHLQVHSEYPWYMIVPFLREAVWKLTQLDAELGKLIEQCLQYDPAQRPTAIQLRDNPAVKKYSTAEMPLHPGRS